MNKKHTKRTLIVRTTSDLKEARHIKYFMQFLGLEVSLVAAGTWETVRDEELFFLYHTPDHRITEVDWISGADDGYAVLDCSSVMVRARPCVQEKVCPAVITITGTDKQES